MSQPVFIIAEAGVNHNGSMDLARQLIDVAAAAGADAVKFQTFRSEAVISRAAKKAEYQVTNTGSDESQLDMVRKLELGVEEHRVLITHARNRGIRFLSTPFDIESLNVLVNIFDLPQLKVPSGEITNLPLLLAAGSSRRPLIVSTGMATLGEVEQALAVLAFAMSASTDARPSEQGIREAYLSDAGQRLLKERISLLHCTTEYPAPVGEVNLSAMETMRHAFGLPVGYSDHTEGIHVSVAAVALGATIIEKHFTLDRNLPGPDHVASLEPKELEAMVRAIRDIESAIGNGLKLPASSELKNIPIARKSLVAAKDIAKGAMFNAENLTTKRPGSGVSAMRYEEFMGRPASRDYSADELIEGY
ncbi:MAG: N-acetylneuraminate synthase [Burkholderiales bacterium]